MDLAAQAGDDLSRFAFDVKLDVLDFDVEQRQINYERAVAGFTTYGTTPAMVAANRQQAELAAAVRQERLDAEIAKLRGELSGLNSRVALALTDARAYLDAAPAWPQGDAAQAALYAAISSWSTSAPAWLTAVDGLDSAAADTGDGAYLAGSTQWDAAGSALRVLDGFPGCQG